MSGDARDEGRWAPRLTLAGFVVCAAYLLSAALREWWLTDDALIAFRYVDNLVAGEGLVFNPGERLEAFSSPLFIVLLAPFVWLGADPFVVAPTIGILATLLELCSLFLLLRRSAVAALVAGLLFAGDRIVQVWASGGLETALVSLLVFASLCCSVWQLRDDTPARLVDWASAVHLLLALARPEGLAYYAIYLSSVVWRGGAARTATLVRSLLVVGVGVLACEALRWTYYDAWLPHTYAAKLEGVPVAAFGRGYLRAFAIREGFVGVPLAIWLSAPLACVCAWLLARRGDAQPHTRARQRELTQVAVLAGAYVGVGAAIVGLEGGDYMTDFRFMRPLLGVLSVGVAALLGVGFGSRYRSVCVASVGLAVALLAVHAQRQRQPTPVFVDAPAPAAHKLANAVTEQEAARMRAALLRFAEPGDAILADRSGLIGYGHTLRTVDATGLTSAQLEGDFYLRPEWATERFRERLPGHARWPKVEFMQREGFAVITPKLSSEGPEHAEVGEHANRRYRRYPFLHVTLALGEGEYLRFFTALSADELLRRAQARELELCWRAPKQEVFCADTAVEPAHATREPEIEQPPGIEATTQAPAQSPADALAQYFGAMRAADCAWLRASTAGVQAQRDALLTCAQLEAGLEHMAPIRLWSIADERPGRSADERLLDAKIFIEGKDRAVTVSVAWDGETWRVTRM